jgi:hypothetical protein
MGARYTQLINRLIAADDLHYDANERRYISVSPEEVQEITAQCRHNGITDDALINKYVQWFGEVRIGQILHRSFLNGHARITGFDGNEPRFAPMERTP